MTTPSTQALVFFKIRAQEGYFKAKTGFWNVIRQIWLNRDFGDPLD